MGGPVRLPMVRDFDQSLIIWTHVCVPFTIQGEIAMSIRVQTYTVHFSGFAPQTIATNQGAKAAMMAVYDQLTQAAEANGIPGPCLSDLPIIINHDWMEIAV